MARVYLARDLRYDKPVALKVLSPELSAALGTERFLREIHIVAHLNHPHILPLLDSGEAEGKLFYVMPYVAAGSLRNRLRRETQLSIEDAIAITRDVAGALDHAHRQGFVHRDVKPENILMSEGLAIVADFGIARAITLASGDDDRITQTGVSPGTPPYMSPEQASNGEVDGRSDIYALGCVLYELLAGQPPFTGPTTQAILARHLADPVPPLRSVRKTVSEGLEQVVLKSLEKVPADRFATAGEFAAALVGHEDYRRHQWLRVAAMGSTAMAVAAVAWFASGRWPVGTAAPVDTTSYAVFPLERDSGLPSKNEDQLLQDAIVHWTGIRVVDRPRLSEELPRNQTRLTVSDAAAVARRVGAGRYVLGQLSRIGDSLRIHSAVYSTTARGPPIHEGTAKAGLSIEQAGPAFASIANQLLFGDSGPGARLDESGSTISRPARQAFERGLDSIYAWNLTVADSAFNESTRYDPQYTSALLWLALVRSWTGAPTAAWQSAAERTATRRQFLSFRNRLLSEAVLAQARNDVGGACKTWLRLTVQVSEDFTAWYGLANCLSRDSIVLQGRSAKRGWQFRSSAFQATKAYQRAFQLLPSIHKALSAESFTSVRRLLYTSGNALRFGYSLPPDTATFVSYPSWQGDSLSFVPLPFKALAGPEAVPKDLGLAVRHERWLFHDVATAWVSAYPRSAEAQEALAVSLELLGDPSALENIRRARALAATPGERTRLAGTQAWMLVKFSTPLDTMGLRAARVLADSLLRNLADSATRQPVLLASLATLTGQADLAARLTMHPGFVALWEVPTPIATTGGPLLAYAALGGPTDKLDALEREVDSAVDRRLLGRLPQDERMQWLGRPAEIAFPTYGFKSLGKLAGFGNLIVDAEQAFRDGDTISVRRILSSIRIARRSVPVSDLTFDALYPGAWLLDAIGDPRSAIDWLDPTLNTLAASAPQKYVDPGNAGALVQAMVLRANLAEQVGDHGTAQTWARVVSVLWSSADAFLQPTVLRMRGLAGGAQLPAKVPNAVN